MNSRKIFYRDLAINLKLIGWLPVVGCVFIMATVLVISLGVKSGTTYAQRIVESIVPLVFGLQAAYLLTPENEQALELIASYPTPLPKLLLKRTAVISTFYSIVAIAGIFIVLSLTDHENIGIATVRWLASGIVLGGIATFTSQLTRQGVFGALLTICVWSGSLYGGDLLLKGRLYYLWPLHIYLQPENTTIEIYLLNRLTLIAIGVGLFIAACFLLQNEERALGIK